jgi:cobalamin-dependent methionine synthase I
MVIPGKRRQSLGSEQSTSAIVVHHPQAKYFSV